jgi:hypothetical protein
MKKLFVLCLLASGAAYAMNESAAISSGADSKKSQESAAPAPAVAPLSEADFRREMLAIERERLAVEKERLATERAAVCISILKLTDADVGVYSGTTHRPRCTICGSGLGDILYAKNKITGFRACPTCNTRHEEDVSRLEQIKRLAAASFLAKHSNEDTHAATVAAALAKNRK